MKILLTIKFFYSKEFIEKYLILLFSPVALIYAMYNKVFYFYIEGTENLFYPFFFIYGMALTFIYIYLVEKISIIRFLRSLPGNAITSILGIFSSFYLFGGVKNVKWFINGMFEIQILIIIHLLICSLISRIPFIIFSNIKI